MVFTIILIITLQNKEYVTYFSLYLLKLTRLYVQIDTIKLQSASLSGEIFTLSTSWLDIKPHTLESWHVGLIRYAHRSYGKQYINTKQTILIIIRLFFINKSRFLSLRKYHHIFGIIREIKKKKKKKGVNKKIKLF